MDIVEHTHALNLSTLRRVRVLLNEGTRAYERDVVLTAPVHRRLEILSRFKPHWLDDLLPEGLPDSWIEATGAACWARWYTERRDGR